MAYRRKTNPEILNSSICKRYCGDYWWRSTLRAYLVANCSVRPKDLRAHAYGDVCFPREAFVSCTHPLAAASQPCSERAKQYTAPQSWVWCCPAPLLHCSPPGRTWVSGSGAFATVRATATCLNSGNICCCCDTCKAGIYWTGSTVRGVSRRDGC